MIPYFCSQAVESLWPINRFALNMPSVVSTLHLLEFQWLTIPHPTLGFSTTVEGAREIFSALESFGTLELGDLELPLSVQDLETDTKSCGAMIAIFSRCCCFTHKPTVLATWRGINDRHVVRQLQWDIISNGILWYWLIHTGLVSMN